MCGTKRKRARARVGVSDKGLIILVALLRQANYRTRNDTWRHVTLICRIQSWVVSRENRRYVYPLGCLICGTIQSTRTAPVRIIRVLRRETYLFASCSSSRCLAPPLRFSPTLAFGPITGVGLDGRCLGSLARLAPSGGGAPLGGGTRPLRLIYRGGGSEGGGGPRLGGLSM